MSSGVWVLVVVVLAAITVVVLILRSKAVRDYFEASSSVTSGSTQSDQRLTHETARPLVAAGTADVHAFSGRVKRELLSPGPDPHDLGSGGSRVEVRGVSHWIEKSEMPGPNVTYFVLVREPKNKHDRNAIAVYCGTRKVGYLSAKRAEVYGPLLDACDISRVRVTREEGNGLYLRLPSLSIVRKLAPGNR